RPAVCIVARVAAYFAVVVRGKIFLVYPEFFKTHVCGALGIFNPLFDFFLRTVAATLGKGKLNIQRIYLFIHGAVSLVGKRSLERSLCSGFGYLSELGIMSFDHAAVDGLFRCGSLAGV